MYDTINKYKWRATPRPRSNGKFDARTYIKRDGKRITITMSRLIMGVTNRNIEVDHKDRNPLNNMRANLRICSGSENCMNKEPRGKTSKYKGVSWYKNLNKWRAGIQSKRDGIVNRVHIGYFSDEIEAAKMYDKKAKELHGEFAYLNFP